MKVHTKLNLKDNLTFLGENSSLYLRTAVLFHPLFLSLSFIGVPQQHFGVEGK